jgi:hypothetical protein
MQRQRGERIERNLAHQFDTGGLDRLYVRGLENVHKKFLIQAAAWNAVPHLDIDNAVTQTSDLLEEVFELNLEREVGVGKPGWWPPRLRSEFDLADNLTRPFHASGFRIICRNWTLVGLPGPSASRFHASKYSSVAVASAVIFARLCSAPTFCWLAFRNPGTSRSHKMSIALQA